MEATRSDPERRKEGFVLESIAKQGVRAFEELIEVAGLTKGQILVVGCSSSEIVGETIGKGSSFETANELFEAIYPVLKEKGIFLAAQCCEHLNRALIVERECAEKYGLDPVCVVPYPKAGGSFATAAWRHFEAPVAVEHIRAHAGIDIGGVLIGMHLREVAVPVRLSVKKIGEASILCARTRPKLIGGERAKYE
ncbi:MAG: TIGR01440 family protein [Ruminococcaceae bacterium]|nr:TIGR01440 family protein [Oscillospiraceae bacterium]